MGVLTPEGIGMQMVMDTSIRSTMYTSREGDRKSERERESERESHREGERATERERERERERHTHTPVTNMGVLTPEGIGIQMVIETRMRFTTMYTGRERKTDTYVQCAAFSLLYRERE